MKKIYVLIMLLGLFNMTWGQGSFGNQNIVFENKLSNAKGTILADLNGDGFDDLICWNASRIIWFENLDNNGSFGSIQEIFNGAAIYDVETGDIDKDGDVDIVTCSYNSVYWKENTNGAGDFSAAISIVIANTCKDVLLEDIDRDNDLDIVYISNDNDYIRYKKNNGDGSFVFLPVTISDNVNGIEAIYSADFDNDGDMDILSASYWDDKIAWFENGGYGNFNSGSEHIITTGAGQGNGRDAEITVADFDNDNNVDFAISTYNDNNIKLYKNTGGDGNFILTDTIESSFYAYRMINGDLDNDGDDDIIVQYDNLYWYENINGEFTVKDTLINDYYNNITLFDLDGDEQLDFFNTYWGDIIFTKNIGNLAFAPPRLIYASQNNPQGAVVGDIDGDGDNDVVCATGIDDKLAWYPNLDGQGDFGIQQIITNADYNPQFAYIADIDTDNDNDVLFIDNIKKNVYWVENLDGLGSFDLPVIVDSTDASFEQAATVDIDLDGDLDLLISSNSSDSSLCWYENINGSGSFTPMSYIDAGTVTKFKCVDFDNDGDIDIVFTKRYSQEILWCENIDGYGQFSDPIHLADFSYPELIDIADIDGDGDMDILVNSALYSYRFFAWIENNAGVFGFENRIEVDTEYLYGLIADDVDKDGDIDIVASHSEQAVWYENIDGNGLWSSKKIIRSNSGLRQINVADLTGDGYNEVLAVSYNLSSIEWFENMTIQIISQPADVHTCPNNQATFSITSAYNDYYQWQVNNGSGFEDLTDGQNYSGVNSDSLNISNPLLSSNNYVFRCIISNDNGSIYSDEAVLFVADDENPTITSSHEDLTLNALENCTVPLPDYIGTVTATDNCDNDLTITQIPSAGTPISGADNTITLIVEDNASNTSEVTFNISVVDNSAPTITSNHSDIIIAAEDNCSAILPDYTNNVSATDNCDASLNISQNPLPGTMISGETNTITLTVKDDSENTTNVNFNINVVDYINPTISFENQIVHANADCQAELPDYTSNVIAEDNCDNDLTITQSPESGTLISGNTNTVIFTATDNEGNSAQTQINVIVKDVTNPVIISTHNNETLYGNESCHAILPDYTTTLIAVDNCDPDLSEAQNPVPGSLITGGINNVKLYVTDYSGNTDSVQFNVAVSDTIAPIILSNHLDLEVNADENCQAVLPNYTSDIVAVDNCDNDLNFSQSPSPGAIVSGQNNTIFLSAFDNIGNMRQISFNIAVKDISDPIITCIENQEVNADGSNTYLVNGTEFDPVETDDNCEIVSITNDYNNNNTLNGETLPEGVTTITWTVTDGSGNIKTCSFDVNVAQYNSIVENSLDQFKIYPNPTSDLLFIDFQNSDISYNDIQELVVSDLNGRNIFKETEIHQKNILDLSNYQTGIYIIRIIGRSGIYFNKIIKN